MMHDLSNVVISNARMARTAESTGALASSPKADPYEWPAEPPVPPALAEHLRELDRSIDAGKPLVDGDEQSTEK
jgi:hypothetical protein